MSRFPQTRMGLARIFANLSLLALPISERGCLDVGFSYADLLQARANTIKVKGQAWRVAESTPDLSNEQKEITLLRIIDEMGGSTDASERAYSWLNWFCSDGIYGTQDDTFNRCIEKDWLQASHDTSLDTSTAWLTETGRAVLAIAKKVAS